MNRPGALVLPLVLALLGCGGDPPAPPAPAPTPPPPPTAPPAPELPVVVFLGDSLTAGYGLDETAAYPALVAEVLAEEGTPIRAVNAGVSGDTTAGGLHRIDWLLRQEPDVVVVALGGNDALRALDVTATEDNLRRILTAVDEAGARALLAGMKVPPNYGPEYAAAFEAVFPRLATEKGVPLIPFILEGVGGVAEWNQADGIHPNAEGQRRVAELVASYLRPLLAGGV